MTSKFIARYITIRNYFSMIGPMSQDDILIVIIDTVNLTARIIGHCVREARCQRLKSEKLKQFARKIGAECNRYR